MTATLSLTESQEFIALRGFLVAVLPADVTVIRGVVNRVPEPQNSNFVVYWPLRQDRLGANETSYVDNIFTGSISGTSLTVTALLRNEGPLGAGQSVIDGTAGHIQPGTVIGFQLSGSVGGTGVYLVSPAQNLASETLYAGVRDDLVGVEWSVQLDVHGPQSADNARLIETLFRSEVATDLFAASGYEVVPLYCDDPIFLPFLNDQKQQEYRWTVTACLQLNPVVGTPQQFADTLTPTLYELPATAPP